MIKIICDKCGEEVKGIDYPGEDLMDNPDVKFYTKGEGQLLLYWEDIPDYKRADNCQLCAVCLKKLIDWCFANMEKKDD